MNGPAVRVLLLADTHGVLDPRIAELAQDCALAVHAGDVGASAVLEALAAAAGRVLAVRGNNDVPGKWLGPAADLLALPECIEVPLPGGTLVVEHGHRHSASRRHLRLRAAHPGARAVLYGHSHRLAQDCATAPWILNPGAAGRARTGDGPSCLLLEAGAHAWRISVWQFPALPRGTRVRA
ncbi:metallophosphoesterase family protein [Immundisolibacter sp.]|uniref:metallophosphoesterase family protein n=1 Tax=Immundisolibacter sp. TaxID=1934948 RepID=UPI0025BDB447|nr:metallophosphoesterase family protein [Immundisolibacter sp.]